MVDPRILAFDDRLYVLNPRLDQLQVAQVRAQWRAARQRTLRSGSVSVAVLLLWLLVAGALMVFRTSLSVPAVVALSIIVAVLATGEIRATWRPDNRAARPVAREDHFALRVVVAGGPRAATAHELVWQLCEARRRGADRQVVALRSRLVELAQNSTPAPPGAGRAHVAPVSVLA